MSFQVADVVKHMKAVQADRLKQLQEIHSKLNQCFTKETELVQTVENEIQFTISASLSTDDSRKTASRLAFNEDKQIITVSDSALILPNMANTS
jgi:hypothetical protein